MSEMSYPNDKIARAKLVMRAVDDYQEHPTGQNRGEIRRLLMDLLPDGVKACARCGGTGEVRHIEHTPGGRPIQCVDACPACGAKEDQRG